MKSKKFVSLAVATMLSMGLLTGCGSNSTGTEAAKETQTVTQEAVNVITYINELEKYNEKPEAKEYAPYEHVFFKRIDLTHGYAEKITGGSVEIPEGYQIMYIQNFNERVGNASETGGVDLWLVNTSPVVVEPVYNKHFGYYDYSHEGKVLELEQDTSLILHR